GGGEVDQDELKQQVLDSLVGNRLLVQAAQDAGIKASDEDINDTLKDIAQQNGLGSVDEVISALGDQGVSEDKVRSDAASQYEVTTFIHKKADISEPSDKELRQQYDQMVEQMGGGQGDQGGEDSQSQVPPFDQVRDQLAQQAVQQEENEAVQGILKDLRAAADVAANSCPAGAHPPRGRERTGPATSAGVAGPVTPGCAAGTPGLRGRHPVPACPPGLSSRRGAPLSYPELLPPSSTEVAH